MSIVSLSSAREASAPSSTSSSRAALPTQTGSPSVNLFWVSVPVLSEQSTSTPANSSMDASRLTIASRSASLRAPTAMVTDSTAGMATGIAATVSTSANCSVVMIGIAAEQSHGKDDRHEHNGDDDQVVADLQHRALEVANRMRLLDKRRGFAKEGVRAGGIDQRVGLALADDGAGIEILPGLLRHGQGFAGQRRLVDLHGVGAERAGVGRYDVAEAQAHDVAWHKQLRGEVRPCSVAQHARMRREFGLERGNRVAGLILLPEPDQGVGEEQHGDDDEVGPVLDDGRQYGCGLDHPGDRPPKIAQELEDRVDLLLGEFIGPVLAEPLVGLRLGQALVERSAELRLKRVEGKRFQIAPDRQTWFRTLPPWPPRFVSIRGCSSRKDAPSFKPSPPNPPEMPREACGYDGQTHSSVTARGSIVAAKCRQQYALTHHSSAREDRTT